MSLGIDWKIIQYERYKTYKFYRFISRRKMMILEWRNKIDIQKWMHTQNDISLEEHLDFIDSLKTIKDKLYFCEPKFLLYFCNRQELFDKQTYAHCRN